MDLLWYVSCVSQSTNWTFTLLHETWQKKTLNTCTLHIEKKDVCRCEENSRVVRRKFEISTF